MTETGPTIEELQSQLLEMKQKNEEVEAKMQQLEDVNKQLQSDLGSARTLNAKLMKGLPAGGSENKEQEHQETTEEFLDSFIKPAVEKLGKR